MASTKMKAAPTWTRGPWRAGRETGSCVKSGFGEALNEAKVPHIVVLSFGTPFALGVDVAAVPAFGSVTGSPEATAALIASAPDLYEALDAMTAAFNRRKPLSNEAADMLLEMCEAALARARGES